MGTSDGVNVFANNEVLMKKIQVCAKTLNLAAHNVKGVKLYMGCDVEGHLGKDSMFYLLDFARVFPCEYPILDHLERDSKSIFYRLLRPGNVIY